MIRLEDVLGCVRIMDFRGINIRYTSGITSEDIKISACDGFDALRSVGTNKLGYVADINDLITMLDKSGCMSQVIVNSFEGFKIEEYLYDAYLPIDSFCKICDHYGIDSLGNFLKGAKKQISKLGCYIGENVKFNTNNRRNNNDQNASSELKLDAVQTYADLNGISFDVAYIGACDVINNIVLGNTTENVRADMNLFSDAFISDNISQKEYDQVVLLSKALTYLMRYSDIVFEGMGIFCHMVLKGMMNEYEGRGTYGVNERDGYYGDDSMPVRRKNEKIDYESYETDYYDDPFTKPMKKKKDKDVENFKKFM